MQGQMYQYQEPAEIVNQELKIGALMLDSYNYQAGGPGNVSNNNTFYGLIGGLIQNGVKVDSIPGGDVPSENNILGDYDIILVSYDLMKPTNTLINEKLAEYADNGGIVVYFGGSDGPYNDIDFGWWKQEGFATPQDHLMQEMGINVSGRTSGVTANSLTAQTGSIGEKVGDIDGYIQYMSLTGYSDVQNATSIYKAGDTDIAFSVPVNNGRFYYFGFNPSYFTVKSTGEKLLNIVKAISEEHFEKGLQAQTSISYKQIGRAHV